MGDYVLDPCPHTTGNEVRDDTNDEKGAHGLVSAEKLWYNLRMEIVRDCCQHLPYPLQCRHTEEYPCEAYEVKGNDHADGSPEEWHIFACLAEPGHPGQ